jgi:8-oxo-dGTP pyrophosphatase MutT (NUDIX family)
VEKGRKKQNRSVKRTGSKPAFAREFSSGGVVYKRSLRSKDLKKLRTNSSKLKTEWLITKSTPSDLFPKNVWRLPKGWLDDAGDGKSPGPLASGIIKATEEQIQKAALREVEEEGGIKADIVTKIGTETYFLNVAGTRIMKFVTFYLMELVKDMPKGPSFETAEVAWLSYEDAKKKLSYSSERKVLERAHELLEQGIQESLV